MDNNELLIRMKEKDEDAILQFMHAHGEKLYSRLLLRLGDRSLADKAFRDTIISFCKTITADDSSDPVEALLFGYADRASEDILKESLDAVIGDTLADAGALTRASAGAVAPAADKAPAASAEAQPEEAAAAAPAAVPEVPEQKGKARGGKGLFGLGLVVLSLGIAAVLWVILGLLMDMQLLPEIDLGYSWFSANIAPWF